LNPDNSFEFANVPSGVYGAAIGIAGVQRLVLPTSGNATGTKLSGLTINLDNNVPTVSVAGMDVSDVTIDLGNNPFPEYPGASFLGPFDAGNTLTLHGTLTQAITPTRGPSPKYFRVDVKDEGTGAVIPWAVLLQSVKSPTDLMNALNLTIGAPVIVSGAPSRDGTRRLSVAATSASVNGQPVPRN
jgi:hypothetical protein